MISVYVSERIISQWPVLNNETFTSYHAELVFDNHLSNRIFYEYHADTGDDFMNFLFPDPFEWTWKDKATIDHGDYDERYEEGKFALTYMGDIDFSQFGSFKKKFVPEYILSRPVFQPFELIDNDNQTLIPSSLCHDFVEDSLRYLNVYSKPITRDKMIIRGDVTNILKNVHTHAPVEFIWHMIYFFWLGITQYTITADNFPEAVHLFMHGIGKYMLHDQKDQLHVIENISEINYCYIKNNNIIKCAL